jgi:copper(I)-binding protein
MVTRWNRRLLAGAIALLVPALAGCEAGLDAPTLEFHAATNGISVIDGGINIDNAFVLGPGLNSTLPVGGNAGVFVALLSQTSDTLESVSAPGTASSVKIAGTTVNLPAQYLVDLDGPAPQIVLTGLTKALSGGETIKLVLTFATVGAVTLEVPVEPAAYSYATYSPPAVPNPTASVSPAAGPTSKVSPAASASGAGQPSANPVGSPSTSPASPSASS